MPPVPWRCQPCGFTYCPYRAANTAQQGHGAVKQRTVLVRADNQPAPPELGARDPFAEELASNFTDKVLGFSDTFHKIRGPDGMKRLVGLATKSCKGSNLAALDQAGADKLRGQTPGWRLIEAETGQLSIRQEWKAKDFKSAMLLLQRIGLLAEAEGHHPDLHIQNWNNVTAELCTHSVGGLTEDDFILAAKIDAVGFGDLVQKRKARFWA